MTTLTYRIVRYALWEFPQVIKTGLSLQEAQAHCQRDDTHGDGWFDAFVMEISE